MKAQIVILLFLVAALYFCAALSGCARYRVKQNIQEGCEPLGKGLFQCADIPWYMRSH
jgi:hypothetical protein